MKEKVNLQHTLGITASSSNLANIGSVLIYQAGATMVVFDYEANTKRLIPIGQKPIQCLDIFENYVILGESGHQPRLLVYDLAADYLESSFSGHKYGIHFVKFTPNGRFAVSIGHPNDGSIVLWDWRSQKKIASVRVTSKVLGLAMDPLSRYFVTVGLKHIKFWDLSKFTQTVSSSGYSQILEGTLGILGEHRELCLNDVCCSIGVENNQKRCFTYVMTRNGLLLMFNETYVLEKWLDAKMPVGTCIQVTDTYIACAGSDSKIRLFEPVTLKHIKNFPLPSPILTSKKEYPTVQSLQLTVDLKMIVLYSNRNLVVYDIADLTNIKMIQNCINHSDCIWGVREYRDDTSQSNYTRGFITYSSDGTIRFWNSSNLSVSSNEPILHATLEAEPNGLRKTKLFDRSESLTDSELKTGIRSVAISVSKGIIACGNRMGTIKIYSLSTFEYMFSIEAHEAEVMALDFAIIGEPQKLLLASASRDRLIHIFDASDHKNVKFQLLQTLDDHTSTMTAMLFADGGQKLISCGADKSIIFRTLRNDNGMYYSTYRNTPLKSTVFDMTVAKDSRTVITVSQDKRITMIDLDSGKVLSSFLPTLTSINTKSSSFLNSVIVDPNAKYCFASSSDKSLQLIDSKNGNSLFQGNGHGDLITGIAFINDGSHVVTAGADGCIFIWKLSDLILKKIDPTKRLSTIIPNDLALLRSQNPSPVTVFRYEESGLPSWARQESKEDLMSPDLPAAQGKWAERVNQAGVELYSELPGGDKPVARVEKPRRYSYEEVAIEKEVTIHNRHKTSPFPSPVPLAAANESFNASIHLVEGLKRTDSIPDDSILLQECPFSESIESDTDDGLLATSIALGSNQALWPKGDQSSDSNLSSPMRLLSPSPNSTSKSNSPEPKGVIAGYDSLATPKQSDTITASELELFEALAEKTALAIFKLGDKKSRESMIKVNRIASGALVQGDWTRELLERYSDQLVSLVKEKLSK